jgi:PAS domain S-box-containing protein
VPTPDHPLIDQNGPQVPTKYTTAELYLFASLVESSEDAIISKEVGGKVLTWNRGAEILYGYTAKEMVGNSIHLLSPQNRPDEEEQILARIRAGERVQHFETVRIKKDGAEVAISLTVSPIFDHASGAIIAASHVARDISVQKNLERQLRQTQKMESLGILAGGIAHDFNNLLVGIIGNASLAVDELPIANPVRQNLTDVLKAAHRAADLTRQLLAYAGKGAYVISHIDLSDLIREITTLVRSSIPPRVQLRLELQDHLPVVAADTAQIQQLVMNLVLNAAEAIGSDVEGTVLITTTVVNADPAYLASTFAGTILSPGKYVCIEVHDTGCGMDENTVSKIFDPFFTTKFTGRGLGLAAALGIVQGHKGALKVYSTPGRGSTFKVLLPAVEHAVRAAVQPREFQDLSGTGLILVIDDDDIVRRAAKAALERYGYRVLVAEDGATGLDMFRELTGRIRLVILDMTMPGIDGADVLRQLQTIQGDVRVVLTSGFNEIEAIRRFTGKGLAGFIQKPYTASQLAERVKQSLSTDVRT